MILLLAAVLCLLGQTLCEATCGQRPASARVVNGEDAAPNSWPWQISLRDGGRHWCGGSLIDPQWVVTAAHCVISNPSPSTYTVVVASISSARFRDFEPGLLNMKGAHRRTGTTPVQESFGLKKLYMHQGFNLTHGKNDIALLQLKRPVKLSQKVNTVCLPEAGSKASPGTQCYITGWGKTIGGRIAADTLQQAMLPVASDSDCARVNVNLVVPFDPETMICAGGLGKGGCQGDSGGPFVCKEGGRWVLRGAVSWGHEMCRTDYYSVFARISSLIGWINQKKAGS